MRALLPLLAVAVAAAFSAAPPALLVLRAACRRRDIAAFDEPRLRRYAAASPLDAPRSFSILSYEETCGPQWRDAVTRASLSALGEGGAVLCVGWPGADVCDALGAAALALRRSRPAVCGRGEARAAAVARLAVRLGWRSALLPPAAPRSECGAARRALAGALVGAGVSLRLAPLSVDELARRPHVVILCGSREGEVQAASAWLDEARAVGAAGAEPAQLLVYVDDLDAAPSAPPPTDNIGDSITLKNINLVLSESLYLTVQNNSSTNMHSHNSSLRNSLTSHSVDKMSNDRHRSMRTRSDSLMDSVREQIKKIQNVIPNIPTHRRRREGHEAPQGNVKFYATPTPVPRGEPRRSSARVQPSYTDRPNHSEPHDFIVDIGARVLLLADRRLGDSLDVDHVNIYEAALEASREEITAEKIRKEFGIFEFYLYEISNSSRKPAAVLLTTTARSLHLADGWSTTVELRNETPALELWMAKERGENESPKKGAAPWALAAAATLTLLASAVVTALVGRWATTRRRRRRRRGDAVLAAADFTFPVDERRCVGEGMETMLSCWLQQLHEFGGPELERPDLLPSATPRAPSAPSSTCSVNRVAQDRRIRYKGDVVHVKYLAVTEALELKQKATDVLLVMQNLRHENLNSFIGCLCEVPASLVFETCGRGSLEDVLMADEIKLDWTFRLSLLTDLVKGMRYLHSSPLRVHGRLSSRNCVVDSRWVLRLTDYGLPAFYRAQGLPQPERSPRDLLWTAPELLRELRGNGRSTQPGDVFSFAIIMQEVIVRGEPYCMLALTPDEIVEKLSRPPPLIRPSVSMSAAPPEAVSVMRQCWSEAPDLRPDFHRLHDIFRHLHRGRKINIVDSMFEMLEKYSNNLEELIKERTEQLDMEKKKTEQLLNRMLPRSVAERLMLGSRVEPEEFEEVSIYFSDIVGFTALAARSTPVQVVDLLNDLYTTFDAAIEQYRVYKVETIGDAYMVVGGLPTRTADHAESVATMALHLLHLAGRFRVRHLPDTPLRLRIGLHTGPCCAAVVGLTMPRYCLFGDTVNTASRMESTGAAWRIQVSAATAERLTAAGGYRLRSRGLTMIKGKGAMHTYWLLGKDGFDKPLPTPPPLESEEVLFETDGENDSEASSAPTSTPVRSPPAATRASCATPERLLARQRSDAVSADGSPQPDLRTAPADHSAPYARYRCLGGGGRALRRQWSLERGSAPAAAAGGAARSAPPSPPAPPSPLALLASAAPRPAPRYRTRPEPVQRSP